MRNPTKLLRLAVVLASTAMFTVNPGPASAAPGDCDPMIEDEADLLRVAANPNCLDETLTQVTNITLTTNPWVPIALLSPIGSGDPLQRGVDEGWIRPPQRVGAVGDNERFRSSERTLDLLREDRGE
jgi:hypothetical protein